MPDMAPFGARLIAACFRAVGVDAVVMDTYKGLSLGREFTSGKECFPCQVTLGDILHHLQQEKERLGSAFSPERYVYFLPEADGPCRFGMYNKLQRLVLDRFEEFRDIPIVYVSTENSYATNGIMPPERAPIFRKLGLCCRHHCRCSGPHRVAGASLRAAPGDDGCLHGRGLAGRW